VKKVSITDIAKEAGVSVATVSRALNPKTEHLVKQATLEKIRKIIRESKYSPSRSARSLRHGFYRTIGLPMNFRTDTTSGYVGEIMRGILKGLDEIGYDLKLISQEEFLSLEALLDGAGVDGLIATHGYHVSYPHLEEELKNKKSFPLVIVNDYNPNLNVSQVYIDNYQATAEMVRYALKKGSYNFCLICGEEDSRDARVRKKSFLDTVSAHNIVFDKSSIFNGHFSETGGYEAAKKIFAVNPVFRGTLFCLNDAMAIGVLRALGELGINCPKEVEVVGFDDIAISEHTNPPLTTVQVPLFEMGYQAVKLVYNTFTGESAGYKKIQFDYRLVPRESC